jgi:Asp/Glu/hydantoin racemase
MTFRITLIHAVTVAIEPVHAAFRSLWPKALCSNLLDDSLSPDRARDRELTESMTGRIRALAKYAASTGAEGILFTCSAFGPAIEVAAGETSMPVLKPNEAMFDAALAQGSRIGMLATFPPSVESMEAELHEQAARQGKQVVIETVCVPAARAALRRGDAASHNRLLAEAAPALSHCDTVMLAHFSTAQAASSVSAVLGRDVLTSPAAAVMKLRRLLMGGQRAAS